MLEFVKRQRVLEDGYAPPNVAAGLVQAPGLCVAPQQSQCRLVMSQRFLMSVQRPRQADAPQPAGVIRRGGNDDGH